MAGEYHYPKEIQKQIDKQLNSADWYRYLGFGVAFLGAEVLLILATGGIFTWEQVAVALIATGVGRAAYKYGTRSRKNIERLAKDFPGGPVKIRSEKPGRSR